MSVNHVLTLTKVLGRRPTEKEVGALMVELTKGHKKLNAKSKENKILDSSIAVQRNKEESNKHRRKDSIQATPVQDTIYRYKLPREKVDLIPSKNKRVKGLEYSRNQV